MNDLPSVPDNVANTELSAPGSGPPGEGQESIPAVGALQVGAVLKDRYTLVEELGSGGVGQVFKARDRNLERAGDPNPYIALKALNSVSASDVNARDALQYEALRAKKLSHDNIIRVDDFDWEGLHIFITMEYLNGSPLDALLRESYEGGLEMAKAWPIIQSIGLALSYAHSKGVIHSDVKPSNVFITRKAVVKVLDFGISRPMVKSAQADSDTVYSPVKPMAALTPAYASLEQGTGDPPDPRDDIYSFALVIYELLTGRHPFARVFTMNAFQSGLVPRRIDSLSRTQWDAVRSAMEFQREDRTKTVERLLECLAPPTFIKKYRIPLIIAGAAAAAAAAVFGSHAYSDYVEQKMLRARVHSGSGHLQLTAPQQREVDDSLFLATDYLRDVKLTESPDDIAYVLSEGANNVNQILDSVLAIDADNPSALKLKARVADLYLHKARQMSNERRLPAALALAQNGLRVMPDNLELFHLQRDLCEKDASLCDKNQN